MFLQQEKNSIFQQHQSFASVHDVCPLQTTKRLDENTTCNLLGNKNSNSLGGLSLCKNLQASFASRDNEIQMPAATLTFEIIFA